jgi:type II secretory pathway component PulL
MLDQHAVHGTVEETVKDDIVDMSIHVVVVPTGADRCEVPIAGTLPEIGHQYAAS